VREREREREREKEVIFCKVTISCRYYAGYLLYVA